MSASMAIQRLRDVVSVSRQSRELTTSRLGLVSDKVLNVSVSGYFMSLIETFCAACAQCGAV